MRPPPRHLRPILLPAAAILAVWAIDLGWAAWAGVRVAGLGGMAAAVLLLGANLLLYRRRPEGDRAAGLLWGFAMFFALASASGATSYLAATIGRPFADPWLARADAALGFDWPAWYRWVGAHATVQRLLALAYASMIPQIFVCLLVFPLTGRAARNREFLATLGISIVPTLVGFALFPAECAWVYFDAAPGKVALHMRDLDALRAGAFPVLDIARMHGLVTFPSYHAATAILLAYAARGTLFAPFSLLLNALMLVSTLSEGGHYLVDLIAGVIVAAATIFLVRRPARLGAWSPSASST
jgi:membrane-associated phospholipid phosphatase